MTEYSTIIVTRDSVNPAVALLTLNRPDSMNSFNMEMFRDLQAAYKDLDADNSVRVIVVTGAGRAFCAGADITEGFAGLSDETVLSMHGDVARDAGGELVLDMFKVDTPIIGAINGHAVGIGATMTMAMDIRICSEKTKWAFPFARRGIVFDGASSWFLPRLVGWAKANEWILKADIIPPEEMHRAGYVSEVHASDAVLPRALELAREIAAKCSPTSTANNKRLLRDSMAGFGRLDGAAFDAHIAESRLLNKAFVGPDCAEGVRAFFEKREPNFPDRSS
ncbi:enoyl-CoA hydratase-related protein [Litorimonas sp. WD9-15]|uniref:enoyl-CoA hydratase-related protein n=1 Tax=Litorimonas sp. WD9-15 TaxID=3418716 RepID=UPI003D02849F